MNMDIFRILHTAKNRLKILIAIVVILAAAAATIAILSRWKTVTVFVDGKQITFSSNEYDVGSALMERDIAIGPDDLVEPGLDSKLEDNENIKVRRAVNVKISVDGKHLVMLSTEEDVESLLKSEGIALGSEDRISIERNAKLYEGMEIVITRVETKIITETIVLNYKEVVKEDSGLPNTVRKVAQEGKDGEKQVTTKTVYEDGKQISTEVVSENITANPADRIIVQGTYPLMPVTSSGEAVQYSRVFKARATAYWAVRGVGKTYTASGRKAVRDPKGYSTIAVDPSVVPYGTKLFVEGYGFAIAADTGTAIIGNAIDVYFNTYAEACRWGAKYVNVYVLQ